MVPIKNDIDWFADADLSKYKGKYVAILDRKIIASGIDAKKVLKQTKRKYPKDVPSMAKIPNDETFI